MARALLYTKVENIMSKQIHQEKQNKANNPILLNEAEEVLQSDLRGIDPRAVENANFRTELEYEGYEAIEDYDNNALDSNTDELETSDQELNFDSTSRPVEDIGEEKSNDPQNHASDREI
jgi:hypothetical protein